MISLKPQDFILEASSKDWVFLLLPNVIYRRVDICPQPIFYIILLSSEKMQNGFDSIRLCEHFVMGLMLFLLSYVHLLFQLKMPAPFKISPKL